MKTSKRLVLLGAVSVFFVCGVIYILWSNRNTLPAPSHGWKEAAKLAGLDGGDISQLEEDGILVSQDTYSQIFKCYEKVDGKTYFITSDSLLNAYHFLYEESFITLEGKKASDLRFMMQTLIEGLKTSGGGFEGDEALVNDARRRAQLVVGIALKLVDDSFQFDDAEMNQILNEEIEWIEEANGRRFPDWLGEPDSSFLEIDYSRFRPRGFYTRNERLKSYFRAVSWLHTIPFRVDHDEELVAMLLLGQCVPKDSFVFESYFSGYQSLIGECDDLDIMAASLLLEPSIILTQTGLNDIRQKVNEIEKKTIGPSLINDQSHFAPSDPEVVEESDFRVISSHRTPSAILFEKTTDIRRSGRAFPNGLEIPAALGSAFARNNLDAREKEDILKTIDEYKVYFEGDGIFFQYLDALRSLVDDPEEGAPDFTRKEPWERKSCNSVLGSWAQKRHTYVLHAKQNDHARSSSMNEKEPEPYGFVEPDPEFFAKMKLLIDNTRKTLKENNAFGINMMMKIEILDEFTELLDHCETYGDYIHP